MNEDAVGSLGAILDSGGESAVMATLISTQRAGHRLEGARMWVRSGVAVGEVTIGGCVDATVIEESAGVIRSGVSRVVEIRLGNAEARELGLTCGGAIELLLEPVEDETKKMLRRVIESLKAGSEVVRIVSLEPTSQTILVYGDGTFEGSTGDRTIDAELRDIAGRHISRGLSGCVTVQDTRFFVESWARIPLLVVVGGGAVAGHLVVMGSELGFDCVVVDAREEQTNPEDYPGARDIIAGIPSEIVGDQPLDSRSAVVLVTHDHKFELPVLRVVLAGPVGYIGILGGRRRTSGLKRILSEEGFSDEQLARINAPIGLDIGAGTSAELAVSIVAEILADRAGHPGGKMSRRE